MMLKQAELEHMRMEKERKKESKKESKRGPSYNDSAIASSDAHDDSAGAASSATQPVQDTASPAAAARDTNVLSPFDRDATLAQLEALVPDPRAKHLSRMTIMTNDGKAKLQTESMRNVYTADVCTWVQVVACIFLTALTQTATVTHWQCKLLCEMRRRSLGRHSFRRCVITARI